MTEILLKLTAQYSGGSTDHTTLYRWVVKSTICCGSLRRNNGDSLPPSEANWKLTLGIGVRIIIIMVISIAWYLINKGEHTELDKISQTYKYTYKPKKMISKHRITFLAHTTHTHTNKQERRERNATWMREGVEGG